VRQLLAVVAEHPEEAQAHYVLMLAYRGHKEDAGGGGGDGDLSTACRPKEPKHFKTR
jgi:hypothetical protein